MSKRNIRNQQKPHAGSNYYHSDEEDPVSDEMVELSSDEDMYDAVTEAELVPVEPEKKKKKKLNTTSKVRNRSHHIATESKQDAAYKKNSMKVLKQSEGGKSVILTQKVTEFDFNSIEASEVCDSPRQVIVKKKHFPRNMIGYITKATRIDFSKDKSSDRLELVCDIYFLFDVNKKKCIRTVNGEIIDYGDVTIRFHLPKRFQDLFDGLTNPNALVGSLLMCPEHDKIKWTNEKDEDKSSIPLIFLLKNTACYSKIGLTLEECPSFDDFILESVKSRDDNEYGGSEGFFKIIFDYFEHQADFFYKRETHKSNMTH